MNIYQLQTVKLYMLYDTYQVYIYIYIVHNKYANMCIHCIYRLHIFRHTYTHRMQITHAHTHVCTHCTQYVCTHCAHVYAHAPHICMHKLHTCVFTHCTHCMYMPKCLVIKHYMTQIVL